MRKNQTFGTWLEKHHTLLNSHQLHETLSKSVGFFQAKDPKHTWNIDLHNRFNQAWKDQNPLEPVPPIHIKTAVIKFKGIAVQTVSLFVGASDYARVSEFFKTYNVSQPCFIPQEARRGNPADFEKHLKLHHHLQSMSTALKIENADETLHMKLRKHASEHLQQQVLDVYYKKTDKQSSIYVQCLKSCVTALQTEVQQVISEWCQQNPNQPVPQLNSPNFDGSTIATNATEPTFAATVTPWDFMASGLQDSPPISNTFTPNIPSIVNTNSYAQAVGGPTSNQTDDKSEATVSMANTSIKTLEDANKQLEEANKKLQTQLTEQQTAFNEQIQNLTQLITTLTTQVQAQRTEMAELKASINSGQLHQNTARAREPNTPISNKRQNQNSTPQGKNLLMELDNAAGGGTSSTGVTQDP